MIIFQRIALFIIALLIVIIVIEFILDLEFSFSFNKIFNHNKFYSVSKNMYDTFSLKYEIFLDKKKLNLL